MWKDILKGAIERHTFETKITRIRKGVGRAGNLTMVTYDYSDRGKDSDIDIEWNSVTVSWSMSVEVYGDGLELNAPQVAKVVVDIDTIEDVGEDVELLAENLELETTNNIQVEELEEVVMGSGIMPDADIEIGRKDGEFYIKSVNISW
tara:strand:- start:469 stop:912 length:444 start_codon:yes stop_codon:yes gene_type:complete